MISTIGSGQTPTISRDDERGIFQLLDEFPTGLLLLDAQGAVLRANAIATECLHATQLSLLGRDLFREALPVLEEDGIGARYRDEIRGGSVLFEWEGEISSAQSDRQRWLAFRSVALQGKSWGLVLVENRTAAATAETERKNAERLSVVSELAAGIAHEVNNPLASIRSLAQLLVRDLLTLEQHRALDLIILETARIARSIENLHSFARQRGSGGRETVELNELLGAVLEERSGDLAEQGVTVRRDLDLRITPVFGDSAALRQVVRALVLNAEEALSEVAGPRNLTVRTRESSDGVILSLVNNGPGIPRAQLDHLFAGYGASEDGRICLGVAAAVVREHSGSIWAESETGGGSTFYVRLPRAAVTPPEPVRIAHKPAEPPRPAPLRVLVADDEPTLRLAISMYLGRRGHKVTVAEDAYEALRLVQKNEFDVALVDARMPGDGLRLLEKLEEMPALRGRTALMTGDLGRARSSEQSANERPCLSKPFDMEEAVRLLERLGETRIATPSLD
ncbi:MAG TPA: hybrid sensor histidine kinase/response regulator [Longimicrobiaceae bacterium]|nr:hybrid sensor histidine kinase/response regulator [Longimicrobiaceae bacterium]